MLFEVIVGVYLGMLAKQRYRLPEVMTPGEMLDKVKDAERKRRIDLPDGEEGRKRQRWGWCWHGAGHPCQEAGKEEEKQMLKEVLKRLGNLETMYKTEPQQTSAIPTSP